MLYGYIFILQINLLKKCCVTFVRSTYQLHNLKANQVFYKNKSTCIWIQICYTVHIINAPKSMCAPTQYWQCHLHFYQNQRQCTDCTKNKKKNTLHSPRYPWYFVLCGAHYHHLLILWVLTFFFVWFKRTKWNVYSTKHACHIWVAIIRILWEKIHVYCASLAMPPMKGCLK